MRLRASKTRRRIALGAAGLLVALWALRLWPLPERASAPVFSRAVVARDGSLLRAYLSEDEKWRLRLDSSTLPAQVVRGLLCLEDRRFRAHPGIDPFAVARALAQNVAHSRVISGASTLTMQVARLLEPRPRHLGAKAIEALLALRLEARLSKKEILDLYLEYAPFGANIEGLEAAAQRYYRKPARLLSAGEAAFLFLLPQSPRRWGERQKLDLQRLRDASLARMSECGALTRDELAKAVEEPIPDWRSDFELRAPHLADVLAGGSSSERLASTIDADRQRAVEELVKASEARLRELGISNVGLLAVDNATGEVRVAVGNFDSRRDEEAQKIASFLAVRSPGSLLKPFLYGHLLEAGELLPETLLEDVPVDIGGYRPRNYNGEFQGLVEARLALAHSLNVPWVNALRAHGVDAFYDFLLESGLETPQRREDVGVSMVIGSLETSLRDLVMLYRALADDGQMRALSFLEGEAAGAKRWPWMNAGAAHLVREALKIRGRPDFAIDPRHLTGSAIRWKTGTSQGNHDAWAIGIDPHWTVGVWLGNLDNRASPSLVGPEVSAPLMFDAFARVRAEASVKDWQPAGVELVEVCAFSGLPAGPSCRHRKQVLGVRGLAMRRRCPYHQDILIDEKSGMRITKECELPKMKPVVRSILEFSPDVSDWAKRNVASAELAPPFHPACRERPVGRGRLAILTPEETTYVLHSAESMGSKLLALPLRFKTIDLAASMRCFLNGRALSVEKNGAETLLKVPVGDHVLLCSDQQGRSDQVNFSVEL